MKHDEQIVRKKLVTFSLNSFPFYASYNSEFSKYLVFIKCILESYTYKNYFTY